MSLKKLLAASARDYPDRVAFRFKQDRVWQEWTYDQFRRQVWRMAEAFAAYGVRPQDRVALFDENSPLWPVAYFATVGLGAIAVPVDAKLREIEVAHILTDSEAMLVVCGAQQVTVLQEIQHQLHNLKHVVVLDAIGASLPHSAHIPYHAVEEDMHQHEGTAESVERAYDKVHPDRDDIASLLYTSGTTGRQKGAMITHANFMSNVASCRKAWPLDETDNFLLVLPLHHCLAFTGNLLLPLACGASVSLVESLRTVSENIREVSPTTFIGVPLLLEKMHHRIMEGLQQNKMASFLWRIGLRGPIRKGIRAKLGDRLRLVITGGAPCDPRVLRGFDALGIRILEGYGLTEAAPVLSINPPTRPKPGTIGKPLPDVEIRILDPNEEGVGELAARGPNIMKGYFGNPEATEAVFQDDWLLTGDLGFIDDEGYITLTGRRKSLIVNREGKNIYPEEVEGQLLSSPYVLEALVLGYREANDPVGEKVGVIVVPDQETFDQDQHRADPISDAELIRTIKSEVKRTSEKLAPYKRPRRVQVRMEEFEKTSTSKIKRYLYEMEASALEA